jgi:hypothetical protein
MQVSDSLHRPFEAKTDADLGVRQGTPGQSQSRQSHAENTHGNMPSRGSGHANQDHPDFGAVCALKCGGGESRPLAFTGPDDAESAVWAAWDST